MRAFLAKHQYLVIWILGLIIIGALSVIVLRLNASYLPTSSAIPQAGGGVAIPTPPPAPSVTLTLQANGAAHTLVLSWQNLPGQTTALNIFRGKTASTSTWTLWQSVAVPAGGSGNGSAQFTLGAGDEGYSYYVQAVENNGNNNSGGASGGGGNSTSTQVLWTSNPTAPQTATPTPVPTPTPAPGSTPMPTATPTPVQGPPSTPTPTPAPGPTSTPTPNNYTYYNPQVQGINSGSGAANGNFWVDHVNQSIEIGWQNLPADTDAIEVFRAQSEDGPWDQMLAEQNPSANGSSSLTLVDGTLNDPYYYELTALQGSTTLASYGPIYLAPAGQ